MESGKKNKETKEDKITRIANKRIKAIEKKENRKAGMEDIAQAFKGAERKVEKREQRKKKFRNRLIAILGILGVTAVGAKLTIGTGNDISTNEPEITSDNTKDDKKEDFRETIKVPEEEQEQETTSENDIINQILEEYNSKLPDENKLDKEDMGIILQEDMGEGVVVEQTLDNGDIKFVENINAAENGGLEENEEWVDSEKINDIYVLVDKNSKNTIAGIINLRDEENQYNEIEVERVDINGSEGRVEYVINPDSYVDLDSIISENNKDLKEIYEVFKDYYTERNAQSKNDKETDWEIGG